MSEKKLKLLPKAAFAAAAIFSMALPQTTLGAEDTSAEEIQLLREQIALLQQRLDAIEAREKTQAEAPATTASATAAAPQASADSVKVTLNNKGLALTTADKDYSMKVTARVQADAHFFPDSSDGKNEMYVRRAILTFKGTAGNASWMISPNFASGTVLEDAWVGLDLGNSLFLNAGKLTSLEGLENAQSNAKILFAERGLSNNMTPGREIGLKLTGNLGKTFNYGLSITDGALDANGANNNGNLSDDFLYSGLVKFSPFANEEGSLFSGLTLGLSASIGQEDTTLDGSTDRAMKFKTAGRNTFLTVQTGTGIHGDRYRLNPQLTWYTGPFGLLGEYICSSYEMDRGGVSRTISNEGWTLEASYVLTGENNSFSGVTPDHPFELGGDGWGAFEVGLRYNAFKGDDDLFIGDAATMLATSSSTQKATAYGAVAKWYMTKNLLWALNYEVTEFSGLGADRDDEQVLTSHMQISF